MSGTCIVCLGDLGEGSSEIPAPSQTLAKPPLQDGGEPLDTADTVPASTTNNDSEDPGLIAHLQPCGHNLHNDCLTPWVERANSCPICRQSFHSVQLSDKVGGEIISSYAVEDRTQVADLDPSMFLEIPDEDLESQICQVCEEDDNEDVLMYCDGCQKLWHTYCVGLQEVPYGHWFCDNCRAQRETQPARPRSTNNRSGHRPSNRRTRGQQRRYRDQHRANNDSGWTQVWQSVWDRINLDLDFPYDEDETSATYIRRHRQRNESSRREYDAWQRRMHVAELSGGGGRFRETESTLLDHRNGHSGPVGRSRNQEPSPETETADEKLAWHAFDQAREADTTQVSTRKKKRKSATASPVEPDSSSVQPDRPAKRLRTSRIQDRGEASDSAESSNVTRQEPRIPSPPARRPLTVNPAPGSGFLQSLLKEVEESSAPTQTNGNFRVLPVSALSPTGEHYSPQPSSPALSPQPSNHSSPRAMSATPPPYAHGRPNSPTGLSSSIQPVFPSTEFSPIRSSPEPSNSLSEPEAFRNDARRSRLPMNGHPTPRSRIPPAFKLSSPPPSRPRSNEASPTRMPLSFSAKSDVQKMVSAALKPFYIDQTISKDEYTKINRDISRMLYNKIGDFEALGVEGKAEWEKIAHEEVSKAVGGLKGVSDINGSS